MKSQYHLTLAAISLVWACTAIGQGIYKSVDERGRVTYSSAPPLNVSEEMVKEVKIKPGPTDNQKQEALQRAKQLEDDSRRAAQDRQERAKAKQASSDAELELQNAVKKAEKAVRSTQ